MTWTCLLDGEVLECRHLDDVADHFRLIHPDQELPERWKHCYPIFDETSEQT
jgi:hypothetical protein